MISTREYGQDDWEGICLVHDLARPQELEGSCDRRAFIPLAIDPSDQANALESRKWVAVDDDADDRIVGFVGVNDSYLSWLYVDPAYHRQGIGRRLLRLGLAMAGPKAWTICLAGNEPALKLYASEGLAETRRWDDENAGYPCTCVRLEMGRQEGRVEDGTEEAHAR